MTEETATAEKADLIGAGGEQGRGEAALQATGMGESRRPTWDETDRGRTGGDSS